MSYADAYDKDAGIAIVALGGRFPGARDVEEFWQNLVAGRETISHFTNAELEPAGAFDMENRSEPGYVRARGILEGIDLFDAQFFKMSPREAEVTDPQQRLFLEASWEALERAGYDAETYPGAIGVFASMTNNTYFLANLHPRPDVLRRAGELPMLGNEKDYLATRVSYKLNLRGPSLNIVTACSSSLVAVCQAVQSLLMHQCDMALAGGVSISVPQRRGYLYQEGFITSPDGRCRSFDARAAGTVFSNGLGVVVLKRLEDALAEGDTIYAVIKGTGLNNDGSARVSFTAPSVNGQADAIAMAQANAGIDPDTISYVEAHGTGTALGDPVEIAGLTQAFRLVTERKGFCALGSVKPNIGHLDAAAGVTGLIKTALALHHGLLPPTLHFETPNEKLGLADSPFFINDRLAPWPAGGGARRAGVSSLGAGGTNAHVVLEEAPQPPPANIARAEQLLVVSARSQAALEQASERLGSALAANPVSLADAAFTLQAGRRRFEHRRALVAASHEEAVRLLGGAEPARVATLQSEEQRAEIAFLFPGQGAQSPDMGRGLYENEPVFRAEFDACAAILRPHLGLDLRSAVFAEGGVAAAAPHGLDQTAVTQPALFVTSWALSRLWARWGITPAAMLGHSLGEFAAACIAGVFSRDDALMLVARRARLMQEMPAGGMLAVRAPLDEVSALLPAGISVASINAPKMTVVSGDNAALAGFAEVLTARGLASKRLATSHAFHSAMMAPAVERFLALVASVPRQAPAIPFVSSLTGEWITAEQAVAPEYWGRQMREPVRFAAGAATLLTGGRRVCLEVGPGQTLTALLRQQGDGAAARAAVASLPRAGEAAADVGSMLMAAGRLWVAGASLDWEGLHGAGQRRRVPLPTYPFERKRHWVEAPQPGVDAPAPAAGAAEISDNGPQDAVAVIEEIMGQTSVVSSTVAPARRANVEARLRTLFAELSGLAEAELTGSAAFLELGLDSLFLTQASTAIQKTFAVKITFRDLLEEASTLDTLAAKIESLLPPEAEAPAAVSAAPAAARPAIAPAARAAKAMPAAAEGLLAQVVAQQMELMAMQLEMLRGGDPGAVAAAPASVAAAPAAAAAPASQAPVVAVRTDKPADRGSIAFGPYRPPSKGPTGGMTGRQEQALQAFVERYTQRTAKSKSFTAANRARVADPRTVAGFRLAWKEMVYPIVTSRSLGSKLWDLDGNEYVDLVNGFGMIFFGHNPAFIREALEAQLQQGIEIGPQTTLTADVARMVTELTGMERVAFCNTGSEAVTAAIRMARTVSGRDLIAMFTGAYHGVFDEVLVRPTRIDGQPRAMPIAPGIAPNMVQNILVLEYGSPESLAVLKARGKELAAVLVEPVQSRRPELQPVAFLRELRTITANSETALVFDEVVSGFRVHPGGTQALFGVRADLASYGKVVGGGLPIGLVAGSAKYMDALDGGQWRYGDDSFPEVGVTFFAGTFVRHPLALAAARAVLERLLQEGPELQRSLNLRTSQFVEDLNAIARSTGAPLRVNVFASWFTFNFPTDVPYASLFHAYMRDKGVHLWEGRAGFLTTAHTDEDLKHVLAAFQETLAEMQAADFLPGGAEPPLAGARRGKDAEGHDAWFLPDPDRPGKYLQVEESAATHG